MVNAAIAAGVGHLVHPSVLRAGSTQLAIAPEHKATARVMHGSGIPLHLPAQLVLQPELRRPDPLVPYPRGSSEWGSGRRALVSAASPARPAGCLRHALQHGTAAGTQHTSWAVRHSPSTTWPQTVSESYRGQAFQYKERLAGGTVGHPYSLPVWRRRAPRLLRRPDRRRPWPHRRPSDLTSLIRQGGKPLARVVAPPLPPWQAGSTFLPPLDELIAELARQGDRQRRHRLRRCHPPDLCARPAREGACAKSRA